MTEVFDYAFAGAGLAGLALARALVESDLRPGKLLLIDRSEQAGDRTIGAWFEDRPSWLADVIERAWPKLAVATPAGVRDLDLAAGYCMVRTARLREHVQARLERSNWSITWLHAEVESIDSVGEVAHIHVEGQPEPHTARWVFDSRVVLGPSPSWQSFVALRVRVDRDHFDPERALFMDLRLEQPTLGLEFGHLLAFDRREALIYRVHVGPARRELAELDDYLQALAIPNPQILAREHGYLPLDVGLPTRRPSPRVLRIGVAGGRLKPSTGYAFARMLRDAEAIVDSLVRRDHPFALPRERRGFRMLDGVLLATITRRPQLAWRMFAAMWRPGPGSGRDARLFRLLDERATWFDQLRVMAQMPDRLRLAGAGLRWLVGRK